MRLVIDFDTYEAALLKKVKRELKAVAQRKGQSPPSLKEIVRGAVRMGVHTVYGEDFVEKDILSRATKLNILDEA